jgi:hypothetical protein
VQCHLGPKTKDSLGTTPQSVVIYPTKYLMNYSFSPSDYFTECFKNDFHRAE